MILKRISNLRVDNDMTCVQLAKVVGVSPRAMLHYEKGERDIPTEIIIDIANYFNVSVDYLLGRTNNKKVNK